MNRNRIRRKLKRPIFIPFHLSRFLLTCARRTGEGNQITDKMEGKSSDKKGKSSDKKGKSSDKKGKAATKRGKQQENVSDQDKKSRLGVEKFDY